MAGDYSRNVARLKGTLEFGFLPPLFFLEGAGKAAASRRTPQRKPCRSCR
jgi:hypothetical protein